MNALLTRFLHSTDKTSCVSTLLHPSSPPGALQEAPSARMEVLVELRDVVEVQQQPARWHR